MGTAYNQGEFSTMGLQRICYLCKGLDILELEVDDLYDKKFKENPINFRLLGAGDDGEEWFAMTLKNNEDELFIEDEWKCLKDYLLGIEIIDFK